MSDTELIAEWRKKFIMGEILGHLEGLNTRPELARKKRTRGKNGGKQGEA